MDGETVDFIVRWERGVIDRFIYSIATLSPASQAATPDLSAWNGVLLDKFEGGVAIGHYQGNPQRDSMSPASPSDTQSRTRRHRHREALQSPARRGDSDHGQGPVRLGEPRVALSRRRRLWRSDPAVRLRAEPPGLLDAAIPQYSYPDMVTQTIHVGDCELLEAVGESKVIANPLSMWRT